MKRAIGALVLFLFLLGTASADVGIGLKWYTESEFVSENTVKCITYGIYNPFDTDVTGFLEATKDLKDIYESEEPKTIPAGTSSQQAIPTEICFNIPSVYKEESYLGLLPKKECPEKEVELKGEVVAAYRVGGSSGMGSATGASFAAPLRLRVRCSPIKRSFAPVYALALLIIAALGLAYLKKRRS